MDTAGFKYAVPRDCPHCNRKHTGYSSISKANAVNHANAKIAECSRKQRQFGSAGASQ